MPEPEAEAGPEASAEGRQGQQDEARPERESGSAAVVRRRRRPSYALFVRPSRAYGVTRRTFTSGGAVPAET